MKPNFGSFIIRNCNYIPAHFKHHWQWNHMICGPQMISEPPLTPGTNWHWIGEDFDLQMLTRLIENVKALLNNHSVSVGSITLNSVSLKEIKRRRCSPLKAPWVRW